MRGSTKVWSQSPQMAMAPDFAATVVLINLWKVLKNVTLQSSNISIMPSYMACCHVYTFNWSPTCFLFETRFWIQQMQNDYVHVLLAFLFTFFHLAVLILLHLHNIRSFKPISNIWNFKRFPGEHAFIRAKRLAHLFLVPLSLPQAHFYKDVLRPLIDINTWRWISK